jgi:hypothetical protein
MYNKRINDHWFELDIETKRIMIYREGGGVLPFAYIAIDEDIGEKAFDYEIMAWSIDNNNI